MKCPKCGTEMVWMGDAQIVVNNLDKHFHKLTKTSFRSKDIKLWGVDWKHGDLFCPNSKCGYNPSIKKEEKEEETEKYMTVKQLIKELSSLPKDAKVFIPNTADYVDGYYAVTKIDDLTFSEEGVVLLETDYTERIE